MDAATRKRIEAEGARARSAVDRSIAALGASAARTASAYNRTLPQRRRRSQAQTPGLTPARATHHPKAEIVAKSIPHLLTPAPTPEALSSPARRRAEADGFAQFGKRTWFLVERGGKFRAVENLADAPGWSLVQEMKR